MTFAVRLPSVRRLGWLPVVTWLIAGCGSSESSAPPPPPVSVATAGYAGGGGGSSGGEYARMEVAAGDAESDDDDEGVEEAPSAPSRDVPPAPPPPPPGPTVATGTEPATTPPGTTAPTTPAEVDDTGPLLIYVADLALAVNDVPQRQRQAIESVRAMGGFIARQDDTTVVLRVPAARFDEALHALEALGDVLSRWVQSQDVTAEFRDLEVRLRNALAMRDRLQQILERAGNVQDSIEVERELERITMMIEQMRGRRRFLADRIAFSTITVRMQGLPTETLGAASSRFRLPFPWLDQLGLSRLLDLSTAE